MSNLAIRSFASGELAPAMHARTDLARYEVGLRRCRNFIVMRQGGATKRPGTEFIAEVKDSTKAVRLIPFVFNVRDTLVLEFGHLYVRFYQNGAQVADPDDDTEPYEIASPYQVADIPDLQTVQSADVVTIVHPSYPPYELKRLGATNWTLTAITFGSAIAAPTGVATDDLFGIVPPGTDTSGAYYAVTAISEAGEESLAAISNLSPHRPTSTFPQQITGTATGALTYNVYRTDSANGAYGYIGTGIGETIDFIDRGIIPEYTIQPPIEKTPFTGSGNYPSVVTYYQQRLLFANTNNAPDSVWASRIGFYHNFNISAIVQDDDAITFRIVSDEVDAVRHMLNLGRLLVCTEGAEWILEGDGNGVLTPTSINPRAGSYNGLAPVRPIKTDNKLLYVQAIGAAIRDLQSNVQSGSYTLEGDDVTVFASHLFDGFTITDWAWQQTPLHIVWAVRSDGVLLGLTFIPEQELVAWHRHDTLGFVERVCVVPEGRAHWLYVVVKRLINGQYRRYVERMATTNVTPVFATPEEAVGGPVVTPPPPPPPPPPSGGPVTSPTSPSTTDIGTTGATFNWVAGNLLAPSEISYRVRAAADGITTEISGGLQSLVITGLLPGTNYEWSVRHHLSGSYSTATAPTLFSTLAATLALIPPASGPTITGSVFGTAFTDVTIEWPASTQAAFSELSIAGPFASDPSEDDYVSLGSFAVGTIVAAQRIEHSGFYWLRVRYTKTGFDASPWSTVSQVAVSVVDEI